MTLTVTANPYTINGTGADPVPKTFTVTASGYSDVAALVWYFSNDLQTWSGAIGAVSYIWCGSNTANAPAAGPYAGFSFPDANPAMGWRCEDTATGQTSTLTIRRGLPWVTNELTANVGLV